MSTIKVPIKVNGRGILHSTDYGRGADSREEAEQQRAEDLAKLGHNRWSVNYYWGTVEPFTASLRLVDSWRHASSVYFTFEDENGTQWPMLFADGVEFFKTASLSLGRSMPCKFEVVKRGRSYGIRRVT